MTMIDVMTRGSQDICRSPHLVMADNRDAKLEDGYQFVSGYSHEFTFLSVKLQVVTINPL